YRCLVGHTADADFAVDLAAENWELLFDLAAAIDDAAEASSEYVPKAGGSMTGALLHDDGTAALPAISFAADPDSGFYKPGSNTIGLCVGGVEIVRWDSSQRMGVGVSTIGAMLDI